MSQLVVLLAPAVLAYANGANDNFKGVATLFGSGLASFRPALAWGTLCTALGSVAAIVLSIHLVAAFSGKLFLTAPVLALPGFGVSICMAAAVTVLLASRLGLPISTTHALVGALVGVGLAAPEENAVLWAKAGPQIFLPLALGPLLAMFLAWTGCRVVAAVPPRARRGPVPQRRWGEGLHWLSAGLVSFARGVNDTPKIVALLLLGLAPGSPVPAFLAVGALMALGGVLGARRVAQTMAREITPLAPGQGLTANLITASLVLAASPLGLPLSTTHVSCGALFGVGAATASARWGTIRSIALAWLVTLPLSALLGAALLTVSLA